MDVGNCRAKSCQAPIRWLRTLKGKRLCVDRDPIVHADAYETPRGVFYLDEYDRAISWAPGILLAEDAELFRSHWGTCAAPEEFRS